MINMTISKIGSQGSAAGYINTPNADGSQPEVTYTYAFNNGHLLCMAWQGNNIVAESYC